jgi:GntR family transcriptional regulator, transcriptional repressor for pyruvate dehydrogenase complex
MAANTVEEMDRPKKIAMILAEKIVHQIAADRLEPGSKLAPEREMLADFGVGRGTLREALRFLELQGVITLRPGPKGGPIVADPSDRQLASTLALLLELDRTPYADILSARVTLEPVLAEQAAERITDAQLDVLQAECDQMRATLAEPELFAEQHHRFHRLVVEASGNHVFLLVMSSLHWIAEGNVPWSAIPVRERRAIAGRHDQILAALRAHDGNAAREAMRDHDLKYERYASRTQPDALHSIVRWGSRLA